MNTTGNNHHYNQDPLTDRTNNKNLNNTSSNYSTRIFKSIADKISYKES